MKSASSTQLAAASNTSGATFRQRQIFDHHHSDEYVPPIGARYSGACDVAVSVIARRFAGGRVVLPQPRVRGEVALPPGSSASGRACASTGSGVEPVVSTPMPITRSREKPGSRPRVGERAGHRGAQPLDVVGRILPRQVRLLRIEQHALLAARIVEDARADHPPVGGVDDDGADRVGPVVDADGVGGAWPDLGQLRNYQLPTPKELLLGVWESGSSGSCHLSHQDRRHDVEDVGTGAGRARLVERGCCAKMRTALSERLAKLIMLRSMARVGSSR